MGPILYRMQSAQVTQGNSPEVMYIPVGRLLFKGITIVSYSTHVTSLKKAPREARITTPHWAVSYFGTRQFGVLEAQVNARRVHNSHLPHHNFGIIVQQELGVFVLSILGPM